MLNQFSRAVMDAETPHAQSDALKVVAPLNTPSNQQIINASKQAYAQHQAAVDAMTIALVNIISSGSQIDAIMHLDSLNWLSPGISADVVDPIYNAPQVVAAITAAGKDPALRSFSVGVFSNALPGGNIGTIGFDRNLGSTTSTGSTLTLDLYKNTVSTQLGSNLQLGLWLKEAGALQDKVIGLFIATTVESVPINLKLLLTPSLAPYGFVVSTGTTANIPVTTAVFAGETATWP